MRKNQNIVHHISSLKAEDRILFSTFIICYLPSIDNVQHTSRRLFCHFSLLSSLPCVSKAASILLENCQNISAGVRSVIFERENLACDKAKTRRGFCLASAFNAVAWQIYRSKTFCPLLIEGTYIK